MTIDYLLHDTAVVRRAEYRSDGHGGWVADYADVGLLLRCRRSGGKVYLHAGADVAAGDHLEISGTVLEVDEVLTPSEPAYLAVACSELDEDGVDDEAGRG